MQLRTAQLICDSRTRSLKKSFEFSDHRNTEFFNSIGQKRPFVLLGKSLSISHLIEFERLEAMALGAISPQGRVL